MVMERLNYERFQSSNQSSHHLIISAMGRLKADAWRKGLQGTTEAHDMYDGSIGSQRGGVCRQAGGVARTMVASVVKEEECAARLGE